MRKIKCIIKKILGTTNYKYPIYNGFLYEKHNKNLIIR